jgi:2-polyprenyl-3-methyl-5-hydroxy-6-metoxy-1,4-benzoquinol methylase
MELVLFAHIGRYFQHTSEIFKTRIKQMPEVAETSLGVGCSRSGARGSWLSLSASYLLKPACLISDAAQGCQVARDLTARGFNVTGVDVSARQIEQARRNVPEAQFIEGDITAVDSAGCLWPRRSNTRSS